MVVTLISGITSGLVIVTMVSLGIHWARRPAGSTESD